MPPGPARSRFVLLALLTAVFAFVQFRIAPLSVWEFDESLFIGAIERYEPLVHHPPPPGYPLFIGVAKLVNAVVGDPFRSLVLLSAVSSVAGLVLFALAFSVVSGSRLIGIAGSLLFYVSPAMLVHSTLPQSDAGGLMMLALALWTGARVTADAETRGPLAAAAVFAAAAAATVGMRPQFSIFIVPFLIATLFLVREWRVRFVIVGVFGVACLGWLLPLAAATGGMSEMLAWQSQQAAYFAHHDAEVSRTGRSVLDIVLRFTAHPWGPKWLAVPVFALAAAGAVATLRERRRRAIPLLSAAAVYLLFALAMMDPADGVRYALPSVVATAYLAAVGARTLTGRLQPELAVPLLVAAYTAGAAVYVASIIAQRTTVVSPPVAAAEYMRQHLPPGAVVLYELPLMPHARLFLGNFTILPVDTGLPQLHDRGDVPLFLFSDGGTNYREGREFAWEPSDAYGKLTRNHYRVVSVSEVRPEERFRAVRGVHPLERSVAGDEWRWLERHAELLLPDLDAGELEITLRLPDSFPDGRNEVKVAVDGTVARELVLLRGRPVRFVIPLSGESHTITIDSARSFVPARTGGSLSDDEREIALKLVFLEQREVGSMQRAPSPR
jgi:hypothetical protein